MDGAVVVIGGGAAGLAAASLLARRGRDVLLLEARRRLGGRIWTRHPPEWPWPVELGAEFVHGRAPEVFGRAAAAGWAVQPVGGDWGLAGGAGGTAMPGWDWEERLANQALPRRDRPFLEWLAAEPLPADQKEMARAYVAGFHAADPARISLRSLILGLRAERAIGGEQSYRLPAGYGALVAQLAAECRGAGVRIRTGVPVTAVRWRRGAVRVTAGGQAYSAAQAVITLPLSVLQGAPGAAAVAFAPALDAKREALAGLAMGPAVRMVLRFRRRFWRGRRLRGGYGGGSFVFAPQAAFRAWWLGPGGDGKAAPQLTAWAAGPVAAHLPSGPARGKQALESLAAMFGLSLDAIQAECLGVQDHDWSRDPFSAGAYSFALSGGAGAFAALARPIGDTLFFAGEASESHGHHATVHGALASGERAAAEMLANQR